MMYENPECVRFSYINLFMVLHVPKFDIDITTVLLTDTQDVQMVGFMHYFSMWSEWSVNVAADLLWSW